MRPPAPRHPLAAAAEAACKETPDNTHTDYLLHTCAMASRQEFHDVLSALYGTPLPPRQVTMLYNAWRAMRALPAVHPTGSTEVHALAACLAWEELIREVPNFSILDPCCGTGSITRFLLESVPPLRGATTRIYLNDIDARSAASSFHDIVTPAGWQALPAADLIILSAPYELNDVVLPQAVLRARVAAACHVAGDWPSGGLYRRLWLRKLQEQGRVTAIHGLPRVQGRAVRSCSWLIVWRTAAFKARFWRGLGEWVTCTEA